MATERSHARLSTLKKSRKFRDRARKESRRLHLEQLEDRRLMAVFVLPNNGALLQNGETRTVAPKDLTFRFTDIPGIDPTTIDNGIRLVRAGNDGSFGQANDVVVPIGFSGLGDNNREVVMRFAEALPDDTYQITIVGAGADPLRDISGAAFNGGVDVTINFRLDLGAQVVAVVPQPIRRLQNGTLSMTDLFAGNPNPRSTQNVIHVHFNNDDLDPASATRPEFYRLYITKDTLDPADDTEILPTLVEYDPAANLVRLTFGQVASLDQLGTPDGSRDPIRSFRLRVGTDEVRRSTTTTTRLGASDPGSSFGTALDIGSQITAGSQGSSVAFAQAVEPQEYLLRWPGGLDDPGHREVPIESHLLGGADLVGGVPTIFYNFRSFLGLIPDGTGGGQPAFNFITDAQKQRAREIFELYSRYSGVQFIETEFAGLTVATGDMRVVDPNVPIPAVLGIAGGGLAVMDNNDVWDDSYGGNWFQTAMHEIGHLLGQGHTYDLPPLTIQGEDGGLQFTSPGAEPVFPGDHDIVHMRHMFRPESKDIDMYRFVLDGAGVFTVESFAERLPQSSVLDTTLRLYRQNPNTGIIEEIARNDDYFSEDSLIQLNLEAGTYFVGVSAAGNDQYDPSILDSGIGGTSQGAYEIKFDFKKTGSQSLVDATNASGLIADTLNVPIDGDADGVAGGVFNFWFRAAPLTPIANRARTLFVDKQAAAGGNGLLSAPFRNIDDAMNAAQEFDIVRIVGNGGADGNLTTLQDNLAYQIGFNDFTQELPDGPELTVKKNVTVMIDAGAIFQMRRSQVSVGSTAPSVFSDRSGGALQVLGTPNSSVYFTSYDQVAGQNNIGLDQNPLNIAPREGNWGGLSFRNDLDRADGRFDHEAIGVFLNYVNYADIRYGGGQVNVNSVFEVVTPINMVDRRPTVTNNLIQLSADAAMSANPDSFEETNFQAPRYWPTFSNTIFHNPSGVPGVPNPSASFSLDYERIGPDIHGNRLVNNTTNGLFVRTRTPAGNVLEELIVAGRFNDTDIVHIIQENLVIRGTPGGPTLETNPPPITLVIPSIAPIAGNFAAGTTIEYRITFVDVLGNEGPASPVFSGPAIAANGSAVRLTQLPDVAAGFVARKLYRRTSPTGEFILVDQIPASVSTFDDINRAISGVPQVLRVNGAIPLVVATTVEGTGVQNEIQTITRPSTFGSFQLSFSGQTTTVLPSGATAAQVQAALEALTTIGAGNVIVTTVDPQIVVEFTGILANQDVPQITGFSLEAVLRPRLDASLVIDPSIIVKSDGSRIDVDMGATFLAEGFAGQEIILTSLADDRYGAGGTFDTNSDDQIAPTDPVETAPEPGDWGGVFFFADSTGSIDNAVIAYAGGLSRVEGTFAGINPVEIHQADVRIAQSKFEFNDDGQGGQAPPDRFGRGSNGPGLIFIRGAQPVILGNTVIENDGPFISVNVNALNYETVVDLGRQTGLTERALGNLDNNGPLIEGNRLRDNSINGMIVRGGTLTTESVWDDTDIVHVLLDAVNVPDFHTFGGLRIESSPTESLVVKAAGTTAGITATGRPLEIDDRIGGIVQILGQPGFPVVMTGFSDDTEGAGFTPDGIPQTDTNGDGGTAGGGGLPTGPEVANGTLIDNDVATNTVGHFEFRPGPGGIVLNTGATAQGQTQLFINQDLILDFLNYVDIGPNGGAIDLSTTTIVTPPTLIAPDLVISEGTFAGANGDINWRVETSIANGSTRLNNTLILNSTTPLGALRFINYLDQDILAANDDLLYQTGSPGQTNFRLLTLDNAQRIGFAQGGAYFPGTGLVNATYDGFTADKAPDLNAVITGAGTTYSPTGNVDATDLPAFVDPALGSVRGLNNVTSAMAWTVDPDATTARITSFLELVRRPPATAGTPGEWQGITLDQFAHDRNVETILEQEATLGDGTANAVPTKAQFVGQLGPFEKGGDENLRLGFTIHGLLNNNNDVDIYSFKGRSGTEVWIDIDRTTHALDSIIELVDVNGNVLARSDNSFNENLRTNDLDFQNRFGIALSQHKVPPYQGSDFYSTNQRDPGLRVILPGPANTTNEYFVRVRSGTASQVNVLVEGKTGLVTELVSGGTNRATQIMAAGGPTFTTAIEGNSGSVTELVKGFLANAVEAMRGGGPTINTPTQGGGGSNEVQHIEFTPVVPTAGFFTLTFNGETTGLIPFDATGTTIQAALEALATIGNGNVSVAGGAGGPWDVTFQAALANTNVNPLTAASNEFQQVTAPGTGDFTLTFQGQTTGPIAAGATAGQVQAALESLSNIDNDDVAVSGNPGGPWTVEFLGAFANQNVGTMAISRGEIQRVALAGLPTGGGFTLTLGALTTALIPFNATAAQVQGALEAIPFFTGNVAVTALAGNTWDIAFVGALSLVDIPSFTIAVNEVQTFTLPGNPTGGTFTLTFGGQTTTALPFDATDVAVETALNLLSSIAPNSVNVTKVGNTWSVAFDGGALANTNVGNLTGATNEFQRIVSPVPGGALTVSFNGQVSALIPASSTAAQVQAILEAIPGIGAGNVAVTIPVAGTYDVEFRGALAGLPQNEFVILDVQVMQANAVVVATTQEGGGGNNERQLITLPSNPVGGNFRLTFNGATTAPIAFNASAATVQAALQALGTIGAGNALVTGSPGNWQVQFVGTLANTNVTQITGSNNEFQRVIAPLGSPGFSLIFNGQATTPISATASAGDVQVALVSLNNIGPNDVLVTGSLGGPWDIEFRGAFAGLDVSAMAIGQDEEQLIQIPFDADQTTFTLTFQGQTTAPISVQATAAEVQAALEALPNINPGDVFVSLGFGTFRVRFGGALAQQDQPLLSVTINEVQTLAFQTVPTGGFFTLSFAGQTTGLIPFNASPAAVQLALEALSNIGLGDVAVTGTAGSTYNIEFRGALAGQNVPTIQLDGRGLLGAGLTSGAYQLQLRLREVDELGGSAVRFTKIANAVNGIRVLGQPTHSPLAGEAAETDNAANNTLAGAQFIGNLLNSDRSALSIAGSMSGPTDVDFYALDITYDATQGIAGFSSLEKWWSTIFDIDYADGFARPNLMISVFDPTGELIYSSRDSNIADDRGNPLNTSDVTDLSRGSSGTADPYIGPVELPVGRYLVAVHNEGTIPSVLNGVFTSAAAAPLTRLEPMDSVERIVEDHISFDGGSTGSPPIVPNFINTDPFDPNFSFIPWSLHDVTLFVSQDRSTPHPDNAPNSTRVFTVDAFSGLVETNIGTFGQNIGDLAVHPTAGRLHTYSVSREFEGLNGFRDAQAGNYYQIDVNANTVNLIGDDGIDTFEPDANAPPGPVTANDIGGGNRVGEGVHFTAMTIGSYPGNPVNNGIVGLAVGGRDGFPGFALPGRGVDNINVLYAFLPDTGEGTSLPGANRTGNALLGGNMTDVVERGILDTLFDINPTNANAIIAAEATLAGGQFNIKDANYALPLPPLTGGPAPTRFTVAGTQFEFDAGPEALINISPTLAGSLRDGNNFFVDATRMEFDTGPVINVLGTGNTVNFPGGSSLTITDVDPDPLGPGSRPPRTIVFEFTATGTVTIPNAIPIRVDGNPSNQAMADRIVTAINTQQATGFTTQAVRMASTGRISLTNAAIPTINGNDDSDGSLTGVNPAGAVIEGNLGTNDPAAVRLRIEEVSTQAQLGTTWALANNSGTMPFNTRVGVSGPAGAPNRVTAGFDVNRLNFSGGTTIASPSFTNAGVFRALGNQGGVVAAGAVPVPFLAQDDQAAIANRMATAIVGAGFASAFATPTGVLTGGPLVSNISAPLQQAGQAPGGRITGLTTITQNNGSSTTWAVTNNGGLYQVLGQFGGATLDYINTATDLVGINFAGLTAGPRNIEGQRYLNTLFGISVTGELFAFDRAGILQPFFVSAFNNATGEMEAQTSVQTGLTNVNGLAFSNLNANAWGTVANVRNLDQGHGLNVTHDESREPPVNGTLATNGGTSLRFGGGNYNFLGGAHGSIESEYFSLKGYSAADKPTLYYNYFLETEQALHNQFVNPPIPMRDSLRVFVAGDDGVWHMLTTSDSARYAGTFDDDFDYSPRVQETWDNTGGWRQVRVNLGDFAGRDNLRLRFDFATAGAMNLGTYVSEINGAFNTQTGGDELRAVEGHFLRDGQRFTLTAGGAFDPADQTKTFEFDMGWTLVAPNGAAIPDGARFTIDGVVFEFDKNGTLPGGVNPVRILSTDSPSQVAQKIAIAIDVVINAGVNPFAFNTTQTHDNRVNLRSGDPFDPFDPVVGATSVSATGMPVSFVEGAQGVLLSSIPIPVHSGMDRFQVREAMALVLADEYAAGDRAQVKTHRETIRLLGEVDPIFGTPLTGYRWVSQFAGPHADAGNQRLLGITTELPGDVFGGFNNALRGQNNIFEGVYIDDIIIGFAERGEMVTAAPAGNTAFVTNPQTDGANITAGPYQLEIRRAPEAGVPNPFFPPDLALLTSIDTNDRLTQARQLVAPHGSDINDGQFFTLSDGINSLSFEFNDLTIPGSGVVQGRVRIDYNPRDTDFQIAQRVRNAINSAQVQAVLKIVAQLADGALGTASTTNQVNLLGAVSVPTTGAGASLPVLLPTTGEVNNGTLIDNDTLDVTVGHLEVRPLAGGAIDPINFPLTSEFGATFQFEEQTFINDFLIFQYLSFVDVGSDGNAISLIPDPLSPVNTAVITQLPTLIGEDLVQSRGEFPGANGTIRWTALTQIADGTRVIGNTLTFESDQPLGNLRYINYFDQEVPEIGGTGGDLLYLAGTPGEADFRVVTLDSATRTGFALGGAYDAGPGLVNATYEGFASDHFDLLLQDILGPGTTYSEAGNINTATLPQFFDDALGTVFGLGVPTTAMAWSVDPLATTATVTTSLELEQVLNTNPFDFRTYTEEHGDTNRFRDQGQIILQGNEIKNSSEWGILIDGAPRIAADGNLAHNGPNRNLRELNVDRLVPGVVVVNNVVHNNGLGGMRISGDTTNLNIPDAPVPFVRAVNNTFYGLGGTLTGGAQTDIGIRVDETAAPTLLNNIIANFNVGVSVDASSQGANRTVMGGMLFQGNDTNSNAGIGGDFPILLNNNQPLFVNAPAGNFYLKALSPAIDSSVDSLLDRASLVTVKSPLGIPPSPIISPERDGVGQLRVDDPGVSTPQGFGLNPFKDRGAIDRVDFTGPTGQLINPADNDSEGLDLDPAPNVVVRTNDIIRDFRIRLFDRADPNGPPEGSDVDDLSVSGAKVRLETVVGATATLLVEGVDYSFSYDATNNLIVLTPLGGLWPLSTTYRITLDNSLATGITDKAGNPLQANQLDGTHIYTIFLGSAIDWGDAPATFPTLAPNGANHQVVAGVRLGATVGADTDGQPSPNADLDTSDDGVTDIVLSRGGLSSFTVVASSVGKVDAWLDLDRDGVFDLPGEYIVQGFDITTPDVAVPVSFNLLSGQQGTSYLRVRFSTAGIATPDGAAPDGEVEDYFVTMVGPAFHNGNLPEDVDNNGIVNTIDLLIVLNFINFLTNELISAPGVLTLPVTSPPYKPTTPTFDPTGGGIPGQGKFIDVVPDAQGNFGQVSQSDLLAIINWLTINFQPGGGGAGGEGEAEGEGGSLPSGAMGLAGKSPSAGARSGTAVSGGMSSSLGALLATSLYASPSIVMEERVAEDSILDDTSWLDSAADEAADLVVAGTQSGYAIGQALSLSAQASRNLPMGPLDSEAWDDLLADLSLDVGGLPGGEEDPS